MLHGIPFVIPSGWLFFWFCSEIGCFFSFFFLFTCPRWQDLKPKDIVTRASFENAMVIVMALGGSTNAVLHLIAMAKAFDIELTIDDFQAVSTRIVLLWGLFHSFVFVVVAVDTC